MFQSVAFFAFLLFCFFCSHVDAVLLANPCDDFLVKIDFLTR